jgi:hypothetical protein
MSENDKPRALPTDVALPPTMESHKRKQDGAIPEDSTNRPTKSQRRLLWEQPTEEQLKAEEEHFNKLMAEVDEIMKNYDPVVLDRREIEQQLQAGASVFVLEIPKSMRSHCRASFCIPSEVRGRSNIESAYRLNLKDRTGQRTGEMPHWRRKTPVLPL